MNIRPYKPGDESAVIDLWHECELVVPWNNPAKDIRRKLRVDADLFLVGEVSGKVVASVMGGYEGHRGWINYLAVSPQHQRQGYGRAMMEAVEELIEQKGCPKINLQIRDSNTQISEFYQALGYRIDKAISLGKRLEPDN